MQQISIRRILTPDLEGYKIDLISVPIIRITTNQILGLNSDDLVIDCSHLGKNLNLIDNRRNLRREHGSWLITQPLTLQNQL